MSMDRRGLIASLLPSTILLGAKAALPEVAGPSARLIKPSIGPVLAAWVAEKPDIREAEVEIDWRRGMLKVDVGEDRQIVSRHVDESHLGSFAVSDADARSIVAEIAAKIAALPPPLPPPSPLIRREQWVSSRLAPDWREAGRECCFAAHQERDVIHSSALWLPFKDDVTTVVWAVDWAVADFIGACAQHADQHPPLHIDRWNASSTAEALHHRGVKIVSQPFGKSAQAAAARFTLGKDIRYGGPGGDALAESLSATMVSTDDFGNLIIANADARAKAFLLAASVADKESA